MNLKSLNIKSVYRSGSDNLLEDFYLPCLQCCKSYDRAVGFFSSSILVYAMSGVASLITNGGKMRLIIGYPLKDDEYDALKMGVNLSGFGEKLIGDLEELISNSETDLMKSRLKLFFLMIVTGALSIRFAYRRKGMYHEKIGMMTDSDGNKVLFQGSANETVNAINSDLNYESINVYRSWDQSTYSEYALPYEQGFEDIWNGKDKSIITMTMPSTIYEKIQSKAKEMDATALTVSEPSLDSEILGMSGGTKRSCLPEIPVSVNGKPFNLYEHQLSALRSWSENNFKGIFKLATGAGKTITAMYAVAKLVEANKGHRLAYIVAVPYVALAEQWVEELNIFNMCPIKCYGARAVWEERINSDISGLKLGQIDFFCAVVVNRTLVSDGFQRAISRLDESELFFVGDECHHHSTDAMANAVPSAKYKIGLSATPYSSKIDAGYETDPVKVANLKSVYGEIVSEYNMANALGDGVLTPYNYHIVVVFLDYEEMDRYSELSKEIAKLMSYEEGDPSSKLKDLIRRRNKIISNASGKVPALSELLKETSFKDKGHSLVYVGEGSTLESEDISQFDQSQLQAVADVMMKAGWKVSRFTANEGKVDRLNIMSNFKQGNIDALVSMRVLDEGIDIPVCKRAFILASTTNSRQFVQRRGRILRRAPGKKAAEIYDFVVAPQKTGRGEPCFVSLVKRELHRVMEFVRLSQNRETSESVAAELAYSFGLDVRGL